MLKDLAQKLAGKTVILASTSKPRKMLFESQGMPDILTMDSKFVEDLPKESFASPSQYVKATSHGKILATLEILEQEGSIDSSKEYVVICCDTVVEKDGIIYEKPVDLAQQKSWLRQFSKKTIDVISWVNLCVIRNGDRKFFELESQTRIFLKDLDEELIESYAVTHPGVMQASGGFRIQYDDPCVVERIEGCWYNVVGFPIEAFAELANKAISEIYG